MVENAQDTGNWDQLLTMIPVDNPVPHIRKGYVMPSVEPRKIILINDSVDHKKGTHHNKFWIAQYDEKLRAQTSWGRIGQKGQGNFLGTSSDQWGADHMIDEAARKKMRRNYRKISEEDFELKTVVAQAIGTANVMRTCEYAKIICNEIHPAQQHELLDPDNEIGIFIEVYFKNQSAIHCVLFKSDGNVYWCSGAWGNRPCYFSTHLPESPELDKIKDAVSEILASGKVGA